MSKHTPGRVKAQNPHAGPRGWEVAFEPGFEQLCQNITETNARRLAACWNACEGISTDELETTGGATVGWTRTASKLIHATTQRNELLAVVKTVREVIAEWNEAFVETAKNPTTGLIDDAEDILIAESDQDLLNRIDATIAKATGETK